MRYAIGILLLFVIVACASCSTLGIQFGKTPLTPQEKALEGASIKMGLYYFTVIAKEKPLPAAKEIADDLLKVGNDYLAAAYPTAGYTYLGLVQANLSQISSGKFDPDVQMIYDIVFTFVNPGTPAPVASPPAAAKPITAIPK